MNIDINTILKAIQNLRNMIHAVDREEEAEDRVYGRAFSTDEDFIMHWHTEEAIRKRNTLNLAIDALVDHLPKLSNDMVQTITALQTLGMVYLAKDMGGATFAYASYPKKGSVVWSTSKIRGDGATMMRVPVVLNDLCSWNDEKPVHMGELMQATLGIASPSLSMLNGCVSYRSFYDGPILHMGDTHPCAEQPIGKKKPSYSSFHHFGDLTDNH